MFTCKVCGKKFKASTELGGHMSSAHGRNKVEDATTQNPEPDEVASETMPEGPPEESPEEQSGLSGDDPGVMENIRALMRRGYTPKQVKEQFGYARRTVDQVAAESIEPEGKPNDSNSESGLPVTVKGTEIITPESIMQRLANGSQDWHLRLEGMMLLRAAQKMNRDDIEMVRMQAEADAKLIEPILKLMKETREEQDAAAARAKASSEEIADRAAYETATQLSQVISQNNARITDSINQVRQEMSGKKDDPLSQLLGMMQSMQQMAQMFGVAMPGMMQGPAPGGAQQPWQPPAIKKHKLNETEEKDV
ncbi:MAG: C2H2-type zinc finger protein [Candidatus Omnitrophica bacterium]|nr:C2H2-type zinc finger protein [Candidatus Omnitrophota bacterium]